MNQLLSYSIFFIFLILTKEKVAYIYDDDFYDNHCFEISDINIRSPSNQNPKIELNNLESLKKSQIALNAQNCRQNEKKLALLMEVNVVTQVFQNSKWYYLCALIPKDKADSVHEYIKELNDDPNLDGIFDEIKIDCFSKKFDAIIITLIISLICLF